MTNGIRNPALRKEDEDWKARNHALGDRAEEIRDTDPLLALALLSREVELEKQRLTWKRAVMEREASEDGARLRGEEG